MEAGKQTSARPVAIDLYAGAGGMSLGMEQAGFAVGAAAELDPVHVLTHRYNMPDTPVLCGDLSEQPVQAVADSIRALVSKGWSRGHQGTFPTIDAVVGGPPCQGFSVGGVRDADDERNNQLLRFVDLVVDLQPKVFCLENVAGLLEPRFEALRKEATRRLTVDGGYEIGGLEGAVNAFDYGVPQSRRRVLIMGSRVGPAPVLAAGTADRVVVAEALEGLPDVARYGRLLRTDAVELRDEDLIKRQTVRSPYARRLVGLERDDEDMSRARAFDPRLLTGSLRTVHTSKSVQRFAKTEPGTVEKVSRLYRLPFDGVSRTLRAGTSTDRGSHTSPRPIHPAKPRVITVREAARIHGYPDWFRFHGTNWHGHRQVGNSVPPPLAAAAGRALLDALGVKAVRSDEPPLELGDSDWLWLGRREAVEELRRLVPRI